jgi:bifunctional enzyme CysN/CysC
MGTRGAETDYALALDGLLAEREQGITIDVAYRYFSTERRKYIVADTPGHEQYTRNMITGASTADLAVILVDARKGVLLQTRRHSYLLSLIGVRDIVLAVNKMDLVAYSEGAFRRIEEEYRVFAARIGIRNITAIPTAAALGDNVVNRGDNMPWHRGSTLLEHLEAAPIDEQRLAARPFRMPVQWVNRSNADFRGYAGTIVAGTITPGTRVRILPSGRESTITRIVAAGSDLPRAAADQSITVTLADEIDVARGDLLCSIDSPARVAQQFEAAVAWMGDEPMLRGRDYLMKIGTRSVTATVLPLRYKINVDSLEKVAAESLELNEIGVCEMELDRPIAYDPYDENRDTGGFILIDRMTNETVAAGMLRFELRRSANVRWQSVEVSKATRRQLNRHRSAVVWLTGLPGSGKSTLANRLEVRLHSMGLRTYLLDGDNLRHGLNKDLGFTPADRVENIRRAGEVAKLMVDAGIVVIAAFISPFSAERRMVRNLLEPGEFVEVFVDAPLEVVERRDPKGLYAKARRGELKNFTGIDSPYEVPDAPEIHLDTASLSIEEAEARLFNQLSALVLLGSP